MTDSQRSALEAAFAEYHRTVELNEWIRPPVWPRQQYFLLNSDVREVFYGGAGGGGKSQALFYAALQYVGYSGYAAIIFRRTLKDLILPGALLDRAKAYLDHTPARWRADENRFYFPVPGGVDSSITFAYLENENDKFRYRSAEFQAICFDELTDFTETQYGFLFTRLRKGAHVDPRVPLRMRSASNPGGRGHAWVKRRFVDDRTRRRGAMFIPALMHDNLSLDVEAYRESLALTDANTRLQIEEGRWDAVAGGRFRKDCFRRYQWEGEFLVSDRWRFDPMKAPRFLTCDWNASEKTTSDYTVISDWCLAPPPFNDLVWLECDRFHAEIPDIIPAIKRHVRRWRPGVVGIEAVASNNAIAAFLERSGPSPDNPNDVAMTVKRLSPMGKDKLVRATPAMIRVERGQVYLPDMNSARFPLDDVEAELIAFTGTDEDANDDCVDTLSYAVEMIPSIGSGQAPRGAVQSAAPLGYGIGAGKGNGLYGLPTSASHRGPSPRQ